MRFSAKGSWYHPVSLWVHAGITWGVFQNTNASAFPLSPPRFPFLSSSSTSSSCSIQITGVMHLHGLALKYYIIQPWGLSKRGTWKSDFPLKLGYSGDKNLSSLVYPQRPLRFVLSCFTEKFERHRSFSVSNFVSVILWSHHKNSLWNDTEAPFAI